MDEKQRFRIEALRYKYSSENSRLTRENENRIWREHHQQIKEIYARYNRDLDSLPEINTSDSEAIVNFFILVIISCLLAMVLMSLGIM